MGPVMGEARRGSVRKGSGNQSQPHGLIAPRDPLGVKCAVQWHSVGDEDRPVELLEYGDVIRGKTTFSRCCHCFQLPIDSAPFAAPALGDPLPSPSHPCLGTPPMFSQFLTKHLYWEDRSLKLPAGTVP